MNDTRSTDQAGNGLVNNLHDRLFERLLSGNLVYNTCWEDPAVDRQALELSESDVMLVITSAGCNVLDYLLDGPRRIHAVDANPRQNALLELKLAGIRTLAFEDFFAIFGDGRHPRMHDVYHRALRPALTGFARAYWDRHHHWFEPRNANGSFYYRGLSGLVARIFRLYAQARPRLRSALTELIDADSLDAQRDIYDRRVRPMMWSRKMNWLLSRQMTMNLLGVPHPQRREVEQQHPDGVAGFVREAVDYVFRCLPVSDNYFWTVYIRGHYTRDCCPAYLQAQNFARLKDNLVDRVRVHTCLVADFLARHEQPVSRYVLLDHMDWMGAYRPRALADEWRLILERASTDCRIIFRSAHANPGYLERVPVAWRGETRALNGHLRFDRERAARLGQMDRVHTYAGFHIAEPALAT